MEQTIIDGCKKNSRECQKKLYEELYPKMIGMCMRYAKNKDEAKDFLQDGMIKVFTNIRKYNSTGNFEGWVKRIIRNTIIDELRKRKKIIVSINDMSLEEEKEPEIDEGVKEIPREIILKFIQELPPQYRIVFNLYVFEELRHKEIAEALNISEGTSKSNLFKAKRKLAKRCNEWINIKNKSYENHSALTG